MTKKAIQSAILLLLLLIAPLVHAEYYLQFGSYKVKSGAEKLVGNLAASGIQAVIIVHEDVDPSKGPWHKVRSILSPDREEILRLKRELEESGLFREIVVVDTRPDKSVRTERKVHEPPVRSVLPPPPAPQVESKPEAPAVAELPAKAPEKFDTPPSPDPKAETPPFEDRPNLVRRKIVRGSTGTAGSSEPPTQDNPVALTETAKQPIGAGPIRPSEPSPSVKAENRDDRLSLLKPQVAMASTMPPESSLPAYEENSLPRTGALPAKPSEAFPVVKVEDPEPPANEVKQTAAVAPVRSSALSPRPEKAEESEPPADKGKTPAPEDSFHAKPAKQEERVSGLISHPTWEPDKANDKPAGPGKETIRKQGMQKRASLSTTPLRTSVLSSKQAGSDKRDVTLKWDAIGDPDLSGYKIYYDTNQGPVWDPDPADCAAEGRPPIIIQKGTTEFTLHGLKSSKDYFFSITAYRRGSNVETAYANGIIAPAIDGETNRAVAEPRNQPASRERGAAPDQTSLISAGDVLDIFIPGQREMSKIYDVDPDGNIYLLLAGRIKCSGISVNELESSLENVLKGSISKGDKITVRLLSRERYIEMQRGVRYPGWYRVPQRSKLDDLIAMAGGTPVGADPSKAVLRRKMGGDVQETKVQGEISLHPDDVVVISFPKGFDERIDAGDLIFVSIPEKEPPVRSQNIASYRIAEESRQNRIEVDRRGLLHVPQVGEFLINNLTPGDVTQLIKDHLPKYLAHESAVEVNIVEKRHPVQVLGHVANPGWHNVAEQRNIQEVITAAGGAVDGAVMSDVSIQREWGGLTRNIRVNLYQFSITGDPRTLTPIHANDVVFVPISSAFGDIKRNLMPWQPPPERLEDDVKKKFKIFGAVHHPGVYEPKEEMNLLDAIVTAGGDTHVADMSRILIVRQNKVEVKFNLEDYLSGKAGERLPKIMRGDTIYVSPVPMTYFEPKEDQIFYILGEVKRPTPPPDVQGYKLKDEMTVIQALSLAGGPTEWAKVEHISIIRLVAGKQENIPYNLKRGIAGKYPEINIYVRPNDVIFVP